ncbi:hypothetical protein EBT31_01585 [bacterium]|jgi:hypothetical protein|nr:hypothetical protein [bacterium]NBX48468.1 hypothetical protein [bacterium]
MSKKPSKKEAILEYVKNNPKAKNAEVAKACGVHPTYASMIRRNDGVKTPKKAKPEKTPAAKPDFEFKRPDVIDGLIMQLNELEEQNDSLRDDIVRMSGVIEYLEAKLQHATSI